MALQGTLDTFSLPDVLRLLATTGKTGCLHVEGDRGRGRVWLDEGAVVDAAADRALDSAPTDEIIFEMLRFARGSFNFAADEQAPRSTTERDQPKEVESTLRRATQLLDEWRDLEAVVPSLGHRVAMAPELTVDQVTIDAPRWEALVAIASGRSVGELAEQLDLGELGVSRTVSDLVELGIAVVEPPGSGRASTLAARRPASGEVPVTPSRLASPDVPPPGPPRVPSMESTREPTGERPVPVRENGRSSWPTETTAEASARSGRNGDSDTNGHGKERVETAPKPRTRQPSPRRSSRTPTPTMDLGSRRTSAPSNTTGPSPVPASARVRNGAPLPTGRPHTPPNGATSQQPIAPPSRSPLAPHPPATSQMAPPLPPNGRTSPMTSSGELPLSPLQPERGPTATAPQPLAPPTPPPAPEPTRGPILPASLDTGPLGPSPVRNTGQIPAVAASALPPDLSWAAEDDDMSLGHREIPGSALHPPTTAQMAAPTPSLRTAPGRVVAPPRARPNGMSDGDTALHVAAMSNEARAAVEATVGRSGGGHGALSQVNGRDQLIKFLSSARA